VANSGVEHRFAIILCADVVGYSRLMGIDEEGTLAVLQSIRRDLVDPNITENNGRIVRTMGDGLLVEFSSVIDAVRCAVGLQRAMHSRTDELPADRRIRFRVGLAMGDVVTDGDLIYGRGVDIASRLESLAEPGGINVTRAVRDQVRDQLPIAFEDLGEHQVKNVARPVRVFRIAPDRGAPAPSVAISTRPALPARAAMAVLPFQNLGGDAEAEFFLDSVAEDLITELARARWFSVVARNTSFTYKGKGVDSKQLARELGVRYVVEGSLRKAGDRVRISCQLVEAESGQHLWAERFDGTLEDSFDLQDRITESVIGSVGPVLRGAEIDRARRKPEASQDVYDLLCRAMPFAFAETPEDNREALRLLGLALKADPGYAPANAVAAWCRQQRHLMNWPAAQDDDREAAKRLARQAIDRGAEVPLALAVAGAVRAALTRDHDLALSAVDRATMINPNSALVLGFDAMTRCLCGAYDKAVAHAEKALRLSPLEPLVYHAAFALSFACLMTGRFEDAVTHARKSIEGNRNFAYPYCVLALGCARMDRRQDALEAARRMIGAAPSFRIGTLRKIRFADAARLLADLDLLRAARLPE
jgi:TolB-like protein/class 3 adenylate cyclase/tetratricopeptide (TPR) repeat protein